MDSCVQIQKCFQRANHTLKRIWRALTFSVVQRVAHFSCYDLYKDTVVGAIVPVICKLYCTSQTVLVLLAKHLLVTSVYEIINALPNDLILDMTKLKAFADSKLNVDKMTISLSQIE